MKLLVVLLLCVIGFLHYKCVKGVIVRERTREEIEHTMRIEAAKNRCKDHPIWCNYYFSRGWYDDCDIGGAKWYYCPRSCGYCSLLDAGSPIPTPSPGCKDFETYCPRMAKYGECDSAKLFMKMFCRKSCKLCLEAPPCFDKDDLCEDFAKDGWCFLEPGYMNTFCQKSCNLCIKPTFPPKNICVDKDPQKCAQMEKDKKCVYGSKKEKEYLAENCKKSCKMCAKTGDCFDENVLCNYYSTHNDYCTNTSSRYYTFAQKNCKYSCKFCED